MTKDTLHCGVCAILLAAHLSCFAGVFAADSAETKSLDEQLLRDIEEKLGDEAATGGGRQKAAATPPARPDGGAVPAATPREASGNRESTEPKSSSTGRPLTGNVPTKGSTDEELLKDLDAEDDPQLRPAGDQPTDELGPSADPLSRIGTKMRKAETLIDKERLSEETTRLQGEIVSDIDKLLEQLKRQMQQQQQQQAQNSSGNGQPQASRRSSIGTLPQRQQRAGSQSSANQNESRRPSRESEERLGPDKRERPVDQAALMAEAIKRWWGDLPEREREQMRQLATEEFLPQYREDIEKYFRRLAEDDEELR